MSGFATKILIRFRHCDPAGIVFYPRYFEMLNDVVEEWYAAIGFGFPEMIGERGIGVPLAAVEARFSAPSRLGETLDVALVVTRLGRTSCALMVRLSGPDGKSRVWFAPTVVCADLASVTPVPWPDALRAAMAPYIGDA